MHSLTEGSVRSSFINASKSERGAIQLPDLESVGWEDLDYFGWRDRKLTQVGYIIVEVDDSPVGILLRQAEGKTRTRPQCSWCEDVTLPNDVAFFVAKRAGQAGRDGGTIGTLACAEFECSVNVRKRPPTAYIGFDVDAARQRRIEALRENVGNFARNILEGR